jgi:hypothetical protein
LLAWEEIEDDEETKQRLEDSQRKLLTHNLARVEKDLKEAIWRSYRHIYLLGKDNKLKEIDLGQITSSMGTSLVDVILNELVRTDELTAGVGTNRLIKYWPPAFSEWSTKAVRDAFYSSPLLPRLLKGDSIKRTIADGVRDKSLGYARRDAKGNLILERFGETISENEIEIADDVFILRAEDALKLLEPPKLARLEIHPSHVAAKPGDKVSLTIRASDQYGQPFPTSEVKWTETGGSIDKDGIYHAGADPGVFQVSARAAGIEAVTEVRLSTDASQPPPSQRSDIHTIRWSGPIPPQKWMNFYTKVLSRFANAAGLRLHVHFEVPIEGEAGKAKAEETKAALKELGLPDAPDNSVK